MRKLCSQALIWLVQDFQLSFRDAMEECTERKEYEHKV
jgi:hypothetical protein